MNGGGKKLAPFHRWVLTADSPKGGAPHPTPKTGRGITCRLWFSVHRWCLICWSRSIRRASGRPRRWCPLLKIRGLGVWVSPSPCGPPSRQPPTLGWPEGLLLDPTQDFREDGYDLSPHLQIPSTHRCNPGWSQISQGRQIISGAMGVRPGWSKGTQPCLPAFPMASS